MSDGAVRLTLIAAAPPAGGPDYFLGADGPADEKALARLRERRWMLPDRARPICSPARAARDTASALGVDHAAFEEALRDRVQGLWAGRSLTDLAQTEPAPFARWLRDPDYAPPGGESVAEVVGRAAAWLDQTGSSGSMVAITHAALVRSFVVAGLGCAPSAWFRIDIGHGTRTVLTRNGPDWRVALVNAPL